MKKLPFLLLALTAFSYAAASQPNIIFIMADDLGYGDLGCFGQETLETPRIDQLAAEGMKLTDFYSGNTVCRPSRLSLWTGYDARHTPINGNQMYAIDDSQTTLAELLKESGYKTGGVGKWSLYHEGQGHPNDHGFDLWFGYLDQGLAHNHFPPHLWRNRVKIPYADNVLATGNPDYRGRVSEKKTTFAHTEMTEEALAFIRRNVEHPFLLHVHWTVPHANNEAGNTLGDGMEAPSYGEFEDRDWPAPEEGFASMIQYMDTDVGRIADLVDELGLTEDTLIFFTSDNGPHHEGEHDHAFFDSNGPLRGYKRDLYEGGIRVPLIARWPGTIQAGSASDFPSSFSDVLPTFCELAEAPQPEGLDGISLLPILRGEQLPSDRSLAWMFKEGDFEKSATRMGKWKAIKNHPESDWELYDLSKDISESKDLATENPDVLAQLLAASGLSR